VLGAHVSDFTLAEEAHVSSLAFDADLPAERAQQTVEKRLVRADGSVALVSVSSSLVRNDAGRPLYFFTQVHDITATRSSERSLAGHARQHEAVARLGHIALRDGDPKALMHEVIETVSSTLNVELCNVLELSGDADGLSRVAGVGWSSYGLARSPSPLIGAGSHAQYTLTSKQPVLVNDFSTETRFSRSSLLTEQGVLSGLSVVIDGRDHPFGVLADSTRAHAFTADDVNFDAIKVDRSFVQGLGTDPDDSAIVEAIVKMAQTLGLDVVAEGVETEQQRQQLARLGCRQAQGYLFARPLPALAAGDFLGGHADEFRIRFAG
jgi:hypothetical protein